MGACGTRDLNLDHPGLDTAATRDGERLLIQNDIGTNDVHDARACVHVIILKRSRNKIRLLAPEKTMPASLMRLPLLLLPIGHGVVRLAARCGRRWSPVQPRTGQPMQRANALDDDTGTGCHDTYLEALMREQLQWVNGDFAQTSLPSGAGGRERHVERASFLAKTVDRSFAR